MVAKGQPGKGQVVVSKEASRWWQVAAKRQPGGQPGRQMATRRRQEATRRQQAGQEVADGMDH